MRREFQIEQAAQSTQRPVVIVDEFRVLLENFVVVGARGELEFVDRLGIEEVILAVAPPLVLAAGVERLAVDLPVGERVIVPE